MGRWLERKPQDLSGEGGLPEGGVAALHLQSVCMRAEALSERPAVSGALPMAPGAQPVERTEAGRQHLGACGPGQFKLSL